MSRLQRELYNYLELKIELEATGHAFATESDTEVVLQAYRAWGQEAFSRFNGFFALALFDVESDCVVLARDRSV